MPFSKWLKGYQRDAEISRRVEEIVRNAGYMMNFEVARRAARVFDEAMHPEKRLPLKF